MRSKINHSIINFKNKFITLYADQLIGYPIWHLAKLRIKFPVEFRVREFRNQRFYYKATDENYNAKLNQNFQETQRIS